VITTLDPDAPRGALDAQSCKAAVPGRRQFLIGGSAVAAASVLGLQNNLAYAEPPPETTRIRFAHAPFICAAPIYLAEQFLPMEGFARWEHLPVGSRTAIDALASGRVDFAFWNAPELVPYLDAGRQVVTLAGLHGGCYQLFVHDRVRAVPDLKGKRAAIHYFGSGDHVLLSTMLAYVGIDPQHVTWITGKDMRNAMDLFAEGQADAFVGYAQEPGELRLRKAGRVIVDTAQDRPWSQYFCCMVAVNREFLERNPVATKRALRAIIKAADVCASDPQGVARFLVAKQYETRYPIGLEVMTGVDYARWRTANPEDTLRFYALRLREVGMIKSTPEKLIAQGTDWRFLNELKKELKA
jgi:NitT/TauT family transport system substrate-binding protein